MDKLRQRLGSTRGETLVETLSAILILVFSSLILLSMSLAATRINAGTAEADAAFRAGLIAAEQGGGSAEGSVTIRIDGGKRYTYEVSRVDGEQLDSYDKKS